jgi:hypothetical protein
VDVVFVGLRGSGEVVTDTHGYGSAVNAVAEQVRSLVEEAGLTFADAAVDYPADGTMVADWQWAADLATGDVPFLDGAQIGAERFAATVRAVGARCGAGPRIAAVGFSQGAMAVHLGMGVLGEADRGAVVSVDLIADPLRTAGQTDADGEAWEEQGIVWFAPASSGAEALDGVGALPGGWRSWCAARDPVCAAGSRGTSSAAVLGALASRWTVHSHAYQSSESARPVAEAIAAQLIAAG